MTHRLSDIVGNLEHHRDKGLHVWLDEERRFVDYGTLKRDVSRAMMELHGWGVRSGMNVGIAARNSYEWVVSDLAVLAIGCRLVAIPEELALDQSLFERYSLQLLLVSSRDATDVSALGDSVAFLDGPNSDAVRIRDDIRPPHYGSDGLTVTFSSGTSGIPKAMVISRSGAEHWITYWIESFGLTANDSILIFLPLSHFQQRMLLYVAASLGMDFMLTCPERLFGALARLCPTMIVAPPMFYESIENRVRRPEGDAAEPGTLRAEVNGMLGPRIRWLFTGFAPIRKETLELYDGIGLPIFEGYGVTECGQIGLNTPAARRLGSAGKPVDDALVELGEDGEILVWKRHPLSLGYVGGELALGHSTECFRTGDIGRFDADGFLYVVGRKKELIVTRGGYKVHPQELEDRLNVCGSIQKAVVFGEDMPSLVALLSVAESTSEAEKNEIREFVTRFNESVVSARRIGKVVFTSCALDERSGYLTRTLKLNRAAIFDAFKTEIVGNWQL